MVLTRVLFWIVDTFEFTIFHGFLFVFVNIPYGSKNFKTILFHQIAFEFLQTSPEVSSHWPYKGSDLAFCNLNLRFVMIFFRFFLTWWDKKLQNTSLASNCFWLFSNFSWMFFSVVLTKVLLGFSKVWLFTTFQDFFMDIHFQHCVVYM